MRAAAQPLPFGTDRDRWTHAVREAARLHDAVRAELAGRLAAPASEPSAMQALLLIRERTRGGWMRWEIFGPHPAGVLREAGVFDPEQHLVGRGLCGGVALPRTSGRWEASSFPAPSRSAGPRCSRWPPSPSLGPAASLLPAATGLLAAAAVGVAAAAGLPAAIRRFTRRRARVVETGEAYAAVFFRLLADEQRLRMLAERSGRYELTRAAAVLPRLVWDAAGLVPLAADEVEARGLLLGYGQSLALLVDQAVEVERQEEAVESAIRDDRAFAAPVRPALPEGLLPRHVLDEARLELEELREGLHHAREVLGGVHDDGTQTARSGESDE